MADEETNLLYSIGDRSSWGKAMNRREFITLLGGVAEASIMRPGRPSFSHLAIASGSRPQTSSQASRESRLSWPGKMM